MNTLKYVSKKSEYNLLNKYTHSRYSLVDYSENCICDLFYSSDGKSGNVTLHSHGNDDKVVLFIAFRDIEVTSNYSRNIVTENHIHNMFYSYGIRTIIPPPVYKFYIFDVDTAIKEGYASYALLRILKH